jgi:hypothetical protein
MFSGADIAFLSYYITSFPKCKRETMKYLQKKDNQSFADDDICRSPLDIFRSRAIVFSNKS